MDVTTRTVRPASLGIDFEIVEGDTVVGPEIERGGWEAFETRLFRAHLEPGARVVDLGANVGWYSTLAVLAGCDVHAFEPVPAIADVCERNLDRAMQAGRGTATLHRCAAGADPGTASIALATENRGDNRVLDDGATRPDDMGTGETIEIEVDRVDNRVPAPARLLKIDTQGSEWLALQGARRTLADSPRLALLMEFWPYALRGCAPERLLSFLVDDQGFTLGKATAAPYPMKQDRILQQARARDPVKGGLDLYGTRNVPFHAGGPLALARSLWRRSRED